MSTTSPQRLGDFEIIRELGRGGMGVVYEARQVSLNRQVALKVLSGGLGLTPKAVQRFHREAEAAAKLHHTNIVPVYATSEQDGTHFYAMELIDGSSLDHVIRQMRQASRERSSPASTSEQATEAPRPPELEATGPYVAESGSAQALSASSLSSAGQYFDTAARLMADVADALEHAHQNGVIHRDLKPSNLLLSQAGRLSITDFGLARMLEQPGMTLTGEFVGTPAYMSPEQITAGRIPLDHRTDIYSLGATLYELLTLVPPFRGQSREQVLAQIVQKEPPAPRRVNRKVPVDLETICLKCLEKDPDRRYQTAGQLAEDLRRYVHRFAISARRAGLVERLRKWVRRRPAVASALAMFVLALAAISFFAYRAHVAEQQRRIEQEQAEVRLRDEQERARLQLLDEKIRYAYQVASSGDLKRTDDAIKEIEALGASTGQVRLLRGIAAYFRNDTKAAVSELDQAAKLLPESVAARALLSMAYTDYGQFERSQQLLLEAERLSPSSAEDYLFKGYARQTFEPGRGLADLNEGLRRGDSPLGRALRAIVRTNRAIDSAKPQDAGEALADANAARGMLPNNPLVLFASLYTRVAVAGVYQEAKRMEQRRVVLEEAARDVQALEPSIQLPLSAFAMWVFFEEIGDTGKALDIARRSVERSGNPQAALCCACSLYRQARFNDALQSLDQRQQKDMTGDVTRAFLLAELSDGARLLHDECDILARKYPQDTFEILYLNYAVLLAGRKDQARANFKRWHLPVVISQDWREFYAAMRQFGSGELSEDTYLAKACTSPWWRCFAHFDIGLFRLADGDRATARDHFHKATGTHAIFFPQWLWSQMFLSRMAKDNKWPPWIPVKQKQPQP